MKRVLALVVVVSMSLPAIGQVKKGGPAIWPADPLVAFLQQEFGYPKDKAVWMADFIRYYSRPNQGVLNGQHNGMLNSMKMMNGMMNGMIE